MNRKILLSSVCLGIVSGILIADTAPENTESSTPTFNLDATRDMGAKVSQHLPGYAELQERFEVDEAFLGSVNRIEKSLFVRLRSKAGGGLNAAWWWDPISNDSPKYTWFDFLDCFGRAGALLADYSWLNEWLQAGPERHLELHAYGCAPGSSNSELRSFVKPLWRDAGLSGKPTYEVLARRGNAKWARLFLSPKEERVLVSYTMNPDQSASHWLDRLDVSFHPRCQGNLKNAQYVTILPNGERTVHQYSRCKP